MVRHTNNQKRSNNKHHDMGRLGAKNVEKCYPQYRQGSDTTRRHKGMRETYRNALLLPTAENIHEILDGIQSSVTLQNVGQLYLRHHRKGMFLNSAVSSPFDRSRSITLFLPWQTCSFRHQLGFSGKHSSHAAITHNDYSLTFPPTARYSFIQLSELGRRGENKNAQTSKR